MEVLFFVVFGIDLGGYVKFFFSLDEVFKVFEIDIELIFVMVIL